jgi:hypothetical protein
MTGGSLFIARRFCGPPKSGHGGYVCGRLAREIGGPASVRLTAPPPLDTELRIERSGEVARLLHGANVIGEARGATVDVMPPRVPSLAEAETASVTYLGFRRHAFPRCFACGPDRAAGDGLRVFPGSLDGGKLVAAPWLPDDSLGEGGSAVGEVFLWAALDCTSGWSVLPVPEGKAIVLGELSARIDGAVAANERCVVVGWPMGIEGRKRFAGSAVIGESGRAVAVARATWIEVQESAFTGP